jgi:hypothetical protein
MAHNSVSPDLPLLHKKINRDGRSDRPWRGCLDKQTSETKVANGRNIVSTITAPTNRHALDWVDAR